MALKCMSKRLAICLATAFGAALSFVSSPLSVAQSPVCDPSVSNCGNIPYPQYGGQSVQGQLDSLGQYNTLGGYSPNYGYPNGPLGSYGQQSVPSYVDNLGITQQPGVNRQYGTLQDYLTYQQYERFTPPTEFQQLVLASIGRRLPIFGANLFFGSPSTFAPVEQLPVTPDYVVGPGDQVLVRVWGQINFNAEVTVDRTGVIYLPQVGAIHVAGITDSALAQQIRSNIARIYKNFNLSVNLGQLHSIRIFVAGQARRPGTYTVSSLSTLVSALFASGGPSPAGSLRHIQVRRNGATIADFDMYDLLVRGDKSKDVPLLAGDVIYIPAVGPQVAVFGSVHNPAIFELAGNTSVEQILQDAGGLSAVASLTRASLEHIDRQQRQQALDIALDAQGLSTPLNSGDILRVLPISPRFDKTVTVRGNLADPGRFAWHPGMTLSELLPNSQALITRDYWQRRNQLGLPSPAFQPDYTQNLHFDASSLGQYGNPYTQGRPGYPNQTNTQQNGQSSQQLNGQSIAQLQANAQGNNAQVNPDGSIGQLDANGQPINTNGNGQGYGQDYTQGLNSNGQPLPNGYRQYPPQVTPTSTIGGSTLADQQQHTFTENTAGAGTLTNVSLPAPEIDWSYAVIERLDPTTLKTTLVPFDLGKLVMDHDPAQNLTLEPGDVVTVFSQADIRVPQAQQTKLVRLEGEVAHSGIYSVLPGETLRQLVQRAGGITPKAYLFGSELTRESARIIQQQRLSDYVTQLELDIDRASAATSAAAISAQDQAAAASSLTASQLLVTRLRQLRASGRIVLNVNPDASAIASLPDLELEDGDRFIVPTRPSSINVVGAVYDQNSFIYNDERRVKGYLHQAGGPNRSADEKHSFIIRADGSVISRDSAGTLWGNTFEQARINPGDTIIVPEKVYRGSSTRNLLNYATIFSSFSSLGLAAATLAVIIP